MLIPLIKAKSLRFFSRLQQGFTKKREKRKQIGKEETKRFLFVEGISFLELWGGGGKIDVHYTSSSYA